MRIVVVGGAGFVGSAVSRMLVGEAGATVLAIDKLTHSSSLASLTPIAASPRYSFREADICDVERIAALLQAFAPDAVIHAAAGNGEDAASAIQAHFAGTWRLLETVRSYWMGLPAARRATFRVVGVSRVEAGGCLAAVARSAVDDIMLSWHKVHGLPVIVARSASAFGPYQFPHASVPAAILAGIDGSSARLQGPEQDWIYIDDLASALVAILKAGEPGVNYALTGGTRTDAADLERRIGKLVRRHAFSGTASLPLARTDHASLPSAGAALPALDSTRVNLDTGWRAAETLDSALSKTVSWYFANEAWWRPLDAARSAGDVYGLLRTA